MVFIPLIDKYVLPAWIGATEPRPGRSRLRTALYPSPLRRMGIGMLLAAGSFGLSALLAHQVSQQGDGKVPVAWMIPQYAILTFGEILTSTTGGWPH